MPRRPGALARERARHAIEAPVRFRRLYTSLIDHSPCPEQPLVGQAAILNHLHDHLALRRLNGKPLSWRMILRWARTHDFPLLHGNRSHYHRSPALSTTAALTAWTLTRFNTDGDLFRVASDSWPRHEGKRPWKRVRNASIGKPAWWRPLATIDAEALLAPEASGAMLAAVRGRLSVQSGSTVTPPSEPKSPRS